MLSGVSGGLVHWELCWEPQFAYLMVTQGHDWISETYYALDRHNWVDVEAGLNAADVPPGRHE